MMVLLPRQHRLLEEHTLHKQAARAVPTGVLLRVRQRRLAQTHPPLR